MLRSIIHEQKDILQLTCLRADFQLIKQLSYISNEENSWL